MDVGFADGADGAGEDDLETTACTDVPGGGAPLTTWSSFEPDMNSVKLAGGSSLSLLASIEFPNELAWSLAHEKGRVCRPVNYHVARVLLCWMHGSAGRVTVTGVFHLTRLKEGN